MKEKNKVKKFFIMILLIVILISIILFTLYCIDMNRMKNNKAVVFSTWGYSYVPSINLPEKELNIAITDYLINELDNEYKQYENEKVFISFKTYLIEEKKENKLYNSYCWVRAEKYYLKDEEIKRGSGSSIPYKFVIELIDNKYTVTKTTIPREGSYYAVDMKKIFPNSVRDAMSKVYIDGTIEQLNTDIQNQVKVYFDK